MGGPTGVGGPASGRLGEWGAQRVEASRVETK